MTNSKCFTSLSSAVVAAVVLLASQGAFAQTVCPTSSEGSACTGGLCVPATCTLANGSGGTTDSPCGICYPVGPNACVGSGLGTPCPTGETCDMNNAFGGASATQPDAAFPDAGTLIGFQGSYGTCMVPHDGGSSGFDGGELGDMDGSVANGSGSGGKGGGSTSSRGASSGGGSSSSKGTTHAADAGSEKDAGVAHSAGKDAGASSSAAKSNEGSSGGCSLAAGNAAGAGWLLGFVGLGLALVRRRRGAA